MAATQRREHRFEFAVICVGCDDTVPRTDATVTDVGEEYTEYLWTCGDCEEDSR